MVSGDRRSMFSCLTNPSELIKTNILCFSRSKGSKWRLPSSAVRPNRCCSMPWTQYHNWCSIHSTNILTTIYKYPAASESGCCFSTKENQLSLVSIQSSDLNFLYLILFQVDIVCTLLWETEGAHFFLVCHVFHYVPIVVTIWVVALHRYPLLDIKTAFPNSSHNASTT